jgi:pyroglutamyl-peptidase
MPTILITGFGPFPGAPVNPTTPLVRRLTKLRRPGLGDVRLVGHVFATSYAAVDRELPQLIARHRPDALLMFGVATREKRVRIETRARNALALLPDETGASLRRHAILPGGPASKRMPMPAAQLLAAAKSARVPAYLSRDAGRYLCNYICWRGVETVGANGPRLAAFVHVPPLRRTSGRKGTRRLDAADLARAGEAILMAVAAAARR